MPDGADTVVMREWLLPQEDGSVVIGAGAGARELARGKNVRRAGEDFAAGEVLVPAGRRLRPGDLAAAAAGGRESVAVTRPPAVAIIPTGDEIRPVGSAVGPGEIFDTNSLMLAGRCRQVGAVPVVSDVQPDDPDALAAEIRRAALGADLVLVIAGSSRGRDDHAGAVLAQVGGVAVAGVAVRPGHPALLGHAKRLPGGIAPVIGLPGYPLATAVIFELFAAPLLAAIAGLRQPAGPRLLATLDRDWRSPPGIEDWVLVTLAPRPIRRPIALPAARRDAGQARGRIDQPARPRRRLVADFTRPGGLHRGHGHRGCADPGQRRLSHPELGRQAGRASQLPAMPVIPSTIRKMPTATETVAKITGPARTMRSRRSVKCASACPDAGRSTRRSSPRWPSRGPRRPRRRALRRRASSGDAPEPRRPRRSGSMAA